jgi:hypothetical protein
MGDNWWLDSRANRTFQMQADYDIFLPVNFSMKVSSISPERKTHFLEPDDGPLRSLSIGSQIALQGFVVDKIDPQDQEVTLNVPTVSPDEPFRSYRIRLEGVTDFTSYQRGKTIEAVHGVITNTRQNLLYAQAVAALADTVDLTAERLPLPSGINLPNALWTYESMLSDFIPVRISTVHGDLNMENILVDPATRDVSLIDFATVRRGHALQDLLRLETEVMIMLLPPLLTAQKSLPQVIYDFYKLLHHMTLAPGWELSSSSLSPALTNPLKLILTIRKKAHNCLFDHNDWGEYYRGLTLYLLGALKLKGLDNSPVAPLPKQVAFWAAAALQHLLELPRLTGGPSILPIRPPVEATAIELESPYGTVQPDSGFYIERTADHQGWRELSRSEAGTLFVQAPRQMGKSSLLIRMKHRLEKELNKATVLIDFQKMPEHYFAEESSFYRELCLMIGEALALPEAIDRFWRGPRSVLIKCSRYLSDYLLPQVKRPVVLILDEVERMIDSPFRSDFFGMLRTWHYDRGTDPNFAKLSLLMSCSTEPYLLIDNLHQSPFNVAVPLVLSDFSQAEVAQLNERHSRSLSIEEVADLFELLGSHPFLTRLAF